MKSNTFALQNIKQRIWQALKNLKDTGALQPLDVESIQGENVIV